jgi:hypothetical protein
MLAETWLLRAVSMLFLISRMASTKRQAVPFTTFRAAYCRSRVSETAFSMIVPGVVDGTEECLLAQAR